MKFGPFSVLLVVVVVVVVVVNGTGGTLANRMSSDFIHPAKLC